jgi:ketosteroid isomerase-like protein
MNENQFRNWLDEYGRAWQSGDAKAVMTLFAPGASYYETPFDQPLVGLDAIHDYWKAGAGQSQTDVVFGYEVLSVAAEWGLAHWTAAFVRVPSGAAVRLDGVLAARFDAGARCTEFREWWHRQETAA